MSRKFTALIILIIIVAAIVPYLNAPKGYFIWDDINLILMDYQIKSWNFLNQIFSRDFFGFSDNARKYGYYRPLVTISYMVDWSIWENNPAGYHFTNMAIHVLTCLIIYLLLIRLFRGKRLAPLIATLLFATTPIHTESVTWISGRTDPLCALFFFLSLYYFILYAERIAMREGFMEPSPGAPDPSQRRTIAVLIASLAFYTLSLMAKEMAISLPVILVAYLFIYITGFKWNRIQRYLSSLLLILAISGLYFLLRMYKISLSEQAMDPYDLVTTILSFVKTILFYVWRMLFPVYLSAYIQNDLVEEVFSKEFLVPFVFLVLLVWGMIRAYSRNKAVCFGIAFLLISLLPLSNFIRISGPGDMGFMSAERFLYIPSMALFLLMAILFAHFIRQIGFLDKNEANKVNPTHRTIALVLLAVVLLSYTTLTVLRNRDWYDNETFFKKTLERAPNAPILYMLLGNVYSIEQNWEKAEETLKMAIEYSAPRDREEPTWIYSDLAGVYAKQGYYDKALEVMKLASKTKFHNSAVEYNYGEIYRAMGDLEKAIHYYQRSLMIYRDNLQALVKLGICYQLQGDYELSNKAYISGLNLLPNDADILNNIGYNYSMLGDSQKALHFFGQSISHNQNFARAHANLGMELIKLKKEPEKAVEHLKLALQLEPTMVEPRLALGGLIFQSKPDQAYRIFLDAYKIDPKNIKTILYLGLYHRDTGDFATARQWFEQALKVDPDNEGAKRLIASVGNP